MLQIDLKGKVVFIAGIGDDQGYGWAIAKALAEAGARIIVGTWVPLMKILTTSISMGKFDESRRLSNGSMMEFEKIYPLDAAYDTMEDVPQEILDNKRYKEFSAYSIADVAEAIAKDYGQIDAFIHAIGNSPEVTKPLLETSRKGYLAALGSSSYSMISLLARLGPYIKRGGAALSLTYMASEKVVPGYGGGMSSAKAALESDTQTLAWEAGRQWGIRVTTISAGVYASRAAKAIGFADKMLSYTAANAPLQKDLEGHEVGNTAAFLVSSLASGITGATIYVDNGINIMGIAVDSNSLAEATCCA